MDKYNVKTIDSITRKKIGRAEIGKDFFRTGLIPSTDSLLDMRFSIMKMREDKNYPDYFYRIEIEAIDYLLTLRNKNEFIIQNKQKPLYCSE